MILDHQPDITMKVEPLMHDRFPMENRKMLIDRIRKLVSENVKTKTTLSLPTNSNQANTQP